MHQKKPNNTQENSCKVFKIEGDRTTIKSQIKRKQEANMLGRPKQTVESQGQQLLHCQLLLRSKKYDVVQFTNKSVVMKLKIVVILEDYFTRCRKRACIKKRIICLIALEPIADSVSNTVKQFITISQDDQYPMNKNAFVLGQVNL